MLSCRSDPRVRSWFACALRAGMIGGIVTGNRTGGRVTKVRVDHVVAG
jgi:hypothetical protein